MIDQQGLSRQEFLARLGDSAGTRLPPPLEIDRELYRQVASGEDLVSRFTLEAEASGCSVRTTSSQELSASLSDVLAKNSACKATVSVSAQGDQAIRDALTRSGCLAVDWRQRDGIDAHYEVDVGITDVTAAIAETGTLVLATDSAHSRGAHLAPPIHIAILYERQIIPDMLDLFADQAEPMPSSMVFITGPSKTADIEGVLVTGVHGPGAVHVLLVLEDR